MVRRAGSLGPFGEGVAVVPSQRGAPLNCAQLSQSALQRPGRCRLGDAAAKERRKRVLQHERLVLEAGLKLEGRHSPCATASERRRWRAPCDRQG